MDLPPAVVDIDAEESWPKAAIRRLREDSTVLDEYDAAVRRHLDRRGGSTNYPTSSERLRLIDELDGIFSECSLIGYHCTRLTDIEIDALSSIGMQPLGIEFVHSRIDRAVQSGDIGQQLAQSLREQNYVSDTKSGRRLNMLWLVFSRKVLRSPYGLSNFLGYWGGEALYAAQTDEVRRELATVGRASIVEMVVPVSGLLYQPIGERMLNHYRLDPSAEPLQFGFESPVCQAVAPKHIERVIVEGSDEFARLTGHSCWPKLDGTL